MGPDALAVAPFARSFAIAHFSRAIGALDPFARAKFVAARFVAVRLVADRFVAVRAVGAARILVWRENSSAVPRPLTRLAADGKAA
jgi:hypothetical protein